MKTRIYTTWRFDLSPMDEKAKPRCIFNGDVPHLLRAGDNITILENFTVNQVKNVYYDIPTNSQEVHLAIDDKNNEYPTVNYH